jgi:hypothetical protein
MMRKALAPANRNNHGAIHPRAQEEIVAEKVAQQADGQRAHQDFVKADASANSVFV